MGAQKNARAPKQDEGTRAGVTDRDNITRRWTRREREAAEILGSRRVHRARYERSPDIVPIRCADGTVIVPESKTRARLPQWLTKAVSQARGYVRGAVPLVVLSETGGAALALLPLSDLARLVGLRAPLDGEQLVLLGGPRR